MIKKIFATAALFAFVAAPLTFAQVPGPNTNFDATQNPHAYGAPGSIYFDIMKMDGGVGFAGVNDYNTQDGPDADSDPGDFDGDYEYGTGGGFFPAGFWANEPICQRGYTAHHHTDVHVHDAVFPAGTVLHDSVSFTVGADPSPPTVVATPPLEVDPDGVPGSGDEIVILAGGNECVDDGCICQGELDPDDWLKDCLHKCDLSAPADNTNPAWGQPGGDGGYWVFVNCSVETDGGVSLGLADTDGDTIPDSANPGFTPPTTAGGTCSLTGWIYFPNVK